MSGALAKMANRPREVDCPEEDRENAKGRKDERRRAVLKQVAEQRIDVKGWRLASFAFSSFRDFVILR